LITVRGSWEGTGEIFVLAGGLVPPLLLLSGSDLPEHVVVEFFFCE
jgi:hypothetical protein